MSLGRKMATILIWDSDNQKWIEERWHYNKNKEILFRKVSRLSSIENRPYIIKSDKLRNLWEEWIKLPMTKKDIRRLKQAREMKFEDFSEYYIKLFETHAAFVAISKIIREVYLAEHQQ